MSPVYSPDGENIAFAFRANSKDRLHLYTRALDGHKARKLTRDSAGEFSPTCLPMGNL